MPTSGSGAETEFVSKGAREPARRPVAAVAATLFLALPVFLLLRHGTTSVDFADLGFHPVDLMFREADSHREELATITTAGMLATIEKALAMRTVHRTRLRLETDSHFKLLTDVGAMRP